MALVNWGEKEIKSKRERKRKRQRERKRKRENENEKERENENEREREWEWERERMREWELKYKRRGRDTNLHCLVSSQQFRATCACEYDTSTPPPEYPTHPLTHAPKQRSKKGIEAVRPLEQCGDGWVESGGCGGVGSGRTLAVGTQMESVRVWLSFSAGSVARGSK
jgi:hypothetical protein